MKCPVCWSDKAYRHPVRNWVDVLMRCLFMVPMKCHHCFHTFYLPWPRTLGETLAPLPAHKHSDSSTRTPAPRESSGPTPHRSATTPRRRDSSSHPRADTENS